MKARLFQTLVILALVTFATPAHATNHDAAPWDDLTAGPTVRIIGVIDGDTVLLQDAIDGVSEVRLVGIQAPKLPLGRKNFAAWPLSGDARAALRALVKGRDVTLYFGTTPKDRHGRFLAHLRTGDGTWVQGRMLELGMARVYSFADNRVGADSMLARERQARAIALGIWGHPFYAVRTPLEAAAFIGRFEVVEGIVHDAAKTGRKTYLNFSDDWRSDFTIALKGKARKLFKDAALDLSTLTQHRVRVRGWLKNLNGPMIELSHPEQLEILD